MNDNGILNATFRNILMANTTPQRHTTLQRAAEALSRRNVDMATTELLNEAHSRLALLCYERDDTGQLCNVDEATGKILLPLPWGKLGFRRWGLTVTESIAMRRIMFTRQRQGVPLFFYDRSRRSWFVNLADFPAMPQLKEWEIGIGEYRQARGV
jgi:hypothetical protein